MAKLITSDLTTLANEASAVNRINSNFGLVEEAIEKTLFRDGTNPNAMESDFDMNNFDILNAGSVDARQLLIGGVPVTVDDTFTPVNDLATIASISALRLATSVTVPQLYVVVQSWNAGQGQGGGIFYYDTGDVTSTDDGGLVIVDASSRRWKRIYSGALTPFMFGAVGDGVADDQAALNTAVTVANGLSGSGASEVDCMGYTYAVSAPIVMLTDVRFKNAKLIATGAGWTTSNAVVHITSASDVQVEAIEIDCAGVANNGFRNESSGNNYFTNCEAYHFVTAGFSITSSCQCIGCKARQWNSSDSEINTAAARTAIGFYVDSADVKLFHCVANYTLYPFYFDSNSHHVLVADCHSFNGLPGGGGDVATWNAVNFYLNGCYRIDITGSYIDNGRIVYVRPASRTFEFNLSECVFLNNTSKCTLDAWIDLQTTIASSETGKVMLGNNQYATSPTIPLFKFTTSGSGSFVSNTTELVKPTRDTVLVEDLLSLFNGSNNATVMRVTSSHTDRAFTDYRSKSTTTVTPPQFGCDGDHAIIRTGGTERFRIAHSSGNLTNTGSITAGGAVSAPSSITSTSPTAGIGYATGAGGTVTQTIGKGNSVTLNKICGVIIGHSAALGAGNTQTFTFNNSTIGANDVVVVSLATGPTAASYRVQVNDVQAGSCRISLTNFSAGSLSESVIFNFAVIKVVTS